MTDLHHERRVRGIWIFAAVTAISLHAAIAAFAIAHANLDDEIELGAAGIEIGVELASPKSTPYELPPGPDSEASIATPAVVHREEELKEAELPKTVPTDTQDADLVVTEKETKKSEDEQPDLQKQPEPTTEASIAQEARAMPSIEAAAESPKSVTRDPGTGESKQRIRATWQKELIAHIDRHKRYPADRGQSNANILIVMVLDRTGKVVSAKISHSSGDRVFDEAAMAMVRRADPVPAPPPLVANEGLTFTLPVNFRRKSRS